jgi:hypothetical protein
MKDEMTEDVTLQVVELLDVTTAFLQQLEIEWLETITLIKKENKEIVI